MSAGLDLPKLEELVGNGLFSMTNSAWLGKGWGVS